LRGRGPGECKRQREQGSQLRRFSKMPFPHIVMDSNLRTLKRDIRGPMSIPPAPQKGSNWFADSPETGLK
jgi:hypothetical protein